MKYIEKVFVFADAACKKNPGSASIGVIVKDENGNLLQKFSRKIGNSTNNRAEYLAVLKGLELALKFSRDEVNVFTDSKLIAKQLNGEYRIRNKNLLEIVKRIKVTELLFRKVEYFYIREKRNKGAHRLARMALG